MLYLTGAARPNLAPPVWTLAYVRLAYGSLNLLTAAVIPTLLGLGIDFAVHLLSRYHEARGTGASVPEAVTIAVTRAGPGIVTAALTTAGAFLALGACDFRAFAEMGVATGVGLLLMMAISLALLPVMLVMPALSGLQRPPRAVQEGQGGGIVARLVVSHHRGVVLVGLQ